jgi:hypothetical protein
MSEKLAEEIINASNGSGVAFKKKENAHKEAESNMAFAKFSSFFTKKPAINNPGVKKIEIKIDEEDKKEQNIEE